MNGLWRRAGHDRRVFILTLLSGLPGILVALGFLWLEPFAARVQWSASIALVGAWVGISMAVREHVVRPLGTLANMLGALREGDFSMRARVGDANDALSLAYLEVNNLEEILREQRLGAVEATETLKKVLEEIDVAVFAFDPSETLRIVNRAGERLLGHPAQRLIGTPATELRLEEALRGVAPRTVELAFPGGTGRWELRRSVVRQEGYPLQLLAFSDLSRALREEERQAWKRIIRVLSHEINNSLAPIKSITGSLHNLLARQHLPQDVDEDVQRGIQVISSRAESLGRFMASYAKLARLPQPDLAPVDVPSLVQRVADLETRVPVRVESDGPVTILADGDQLEQALINLLRNGVDATLSESGAGQVSVRWLTQGDELHIVVEDDGPGLGDTANLFVPFYTTKPGGSGIGLALSRQIAESHGGSLTLRDRADGPGAEAVIEIPVS